MEIKLNFETKGVMVDYTTLLKLFKESFKDMTYDFIKEFLDEIEFESHYYMADKIKEGDFSFLELIRKDEDVHLLKEKVEEELKLRGY
jgi:hypothetical protein